MFHVKQRITFIFCIEQKSPIASFDFFLILLEGQLFGISESFKMKVANRLNQGSKAMSDSIQESSALTEILDRLKAIEARAEKFEAKVDKHIETVAYEFKIAAADRQAIRREMDNRFKEVDKRFDSVASASAMREGFMAAAADREAIRLEMRQGFIAAATDREAIRLEMREGFRTATERHEKFKSKTEENNAEIIRIISDVGAMTYQKIDANHQEMKTFQKSTIEALESINHSLKKFVYLEREIEELKKDKALKDATIKRMEQRLTKLEAQINPAT